ncbi:MAG: protein kinase [Chloroflexi bacterium]|nr:protein kinase [Chloroflexota bacterium]
MDVDNLIGQTLGNVELKQKLGAGGMGAVYRGYQVSLKREVAVKVLPGTLANQPGYIDRFTQEAQTAAALTHPHIVQIFDFGTQRNISYVVMQFLRGGSLAERIRQRQIEGQPRAGVGEVASLLTQLGSALDYAHTQHVIHRDVKPANVMFDNHGHAYLVDFGIAKLMGGTTGLTGTGVMMGTPSYMPPEQWESQDLTPAADQYALGVLSYQMIAGRLPFDADSAVQLMFKHFNELPTPLDLLRPDVPGSVIAVVGRAMAKAPEQRFQSCTAFAQEFASAIEGRAHEGTNFFTFKVPPRPAPSAAASLPNRTLPPTPAPTPSGSSRITATLKNQRGGLLVGLVAGLIVALVALVLILSGRGGIDDLAATQTAVQSTLIAIAPSASATLPALVILASDTAAASTVIPPTEVTPVSTSADPATQTTVPFTETSISATENSASLDATPTSQSLVIIPSDTPPPSETALPTETASNTATVTPSASPTDQPTVTPSETATDTPTSTLTATETASATLHAYPHGYADGDRDGDEHAVHNTVGNRHHYAEFHTNPHVNRDTD